MKENRLASKSEQLTKGGSLPALHRGNFEGDLPGRLDEETVEPASAHFWNGTSPIAHVTTTSESAPITASEIPSRFPFWKRGLDVGLVLLTMIIWLPLMIFAMALIKIVSPGPTIYRQRRIGFRGRPFMIFKFRTMKVNADTQTHENYVESLMRSDAPLTKLDANDSRLIAFGRFLRATGLDELPQIFNVLRGEMSLVGPRPCTDREFVCYQSWQKARVNAPPGLTGYWQVNGKNKTTFDQMMQMDLHYAHFMSLGLDLRIIGRTLPAILDQTREALAGKVAGQTRERLVVVARNQRPNGSVNHS